MSRVTQDLCLAAMLRARYTMIYGFDVALSREAAMACNSCETNFQGSQTLVVSIAKSGSRAVLSVGNQGRNIVLIRRILLCVSFPGGGGTATLYRDARHRKVSLGCTLPRTWNRVS